MFNYLIWLVLGLLLANGIPHFTKGITGESWDVPWQKKASSVTNIIWGLSNWLLLLLLFTFTSVSFSLINSFFLLFGMGLIGIYLAKHWQQA